jgi:hypothetical protein
MSITHPDQAEVSIYGMPDSALYDDVARASRKAVELGATVVSSQDNPRVRAIFSEVTMAAAFAIWLSRRLVVYHTYQLTQVAAEGALPWPARDAERVWKNCAALARGYNDHARLRRLQRVDEAECNLIAEAIERTPLLLLTQEVHVEPLPPSEE